ncbi:putative thiol peroxidase [Candidatus Zixiibacteriota bacterium]|nr:putative thiol peroxidase [candidate division Zixibacteria bacterium]
MSERTGVVTSQGNPLTLIGNELKVGDSAPDFDVVDNDLKPFQLSSLRGKVVVISSVPSLDTPVCDTETRRFNKEAAGLGDKVKILTISMDLPFAQKRWCGAAGVNSVMTLSDYQKASFGNTYGVLIKGLHLLARVIFVIDTKGIIRYIQYVKETSHEPNYDDALAAIKKLIS